MKSGLSEKLTKIPNAWHIVMTIEQGSSQSFVYLLGPISEVREHQCYSHVTEDVGETSQQ